MKKHGFNIISNHYAMKNISKLETLETENILKFNDSKIIKSKKRVKTPVIIAGISATL